MQKIELITALKKLISSPNTASRQPVFEKYDKNVQGNTVHERGKVAASVITPFRDFVELDDLHAKIGVAVATGGNPNLAKINARIAAEYAISETALKISCVGGTFLGATDCLNFGNPEKKEQMGELVTGISGIKKACEALEIPIVSGNVSLYNESAGKSVPPSALVSVFGRVDEVQKVPSLGFPVEKKSQKIHLWFLGKFSDSLAGSEFFRVFKKTATNVPEIDFPTFLKFCGSVRNLSTKETTKTCAPIGVGGLWKTLAEAAFLSGRGFEITLPEKIFVNALFGEPLGVLLATTANTDYTRDFFSATRIGSLLDDFSFELKTPKSVIVSDNLNQYQDLWENKLREIF